ncbi:MAG: methylenetetrahydrofolate reductase C-terminal domain-containing protein [Candidatus Bathyarchaeota archaeon]
MPKQKSLNDIQKMINGRKRILILGCDGCSGIYEVGGLREAELLKVRLEMAESKQSQKPEIKTTTVLRQCDIEVISKALCSMMPEVDAVISLACGVGVQTIADVFSDKPIFPGNDTMFCGMEDRGQGKFLEKCSTCGNCLLGETGGVCPITRCAKSLLNGPCGGQVDGKCEVGDYTHDCAWVLIWKRLKERNQLDEFKKFRPTRDRRSHPEEIKMSIHPESK